ncbi:hypothetical protein RUU25_10705, partial [Staphylococcus borealis]|uniref:hypothetical protein n=1 Tax=Staphylococcus borealis TaxID=2742203 RepID=UPI0031341C1E
NSTSKASWESGPQQREFYQEILQTKQAGSGRRIQKNSVPLPFLYFISDDGVEILEVTENLN